MLRQAASLLQRPRLGPAVLLALHIASLALFINGFLLTRVHLSERNTAPPSATAAASNGTALQPALYDRVVWLMIDALRYDFVVSDGRYSCAGGASEAGAVCHQGHMPFLSSLARRQDAAARTFMFVADAPTTTTQRLKALATGGLPSFFDVSNSFTAGAVTDDNLVDQLAAAGRRLAFMGDTTWQQLFPRQWAWSRPYPCFNVKDLHTVDDGVWQNLLPALRAAGSGGTSGAEATDGGGAAGLDWDGLLVAHYLGVDHCGHTHGVPSMEMAGKLRQMDEHVRQVVDALLEHAGPGGTFERTLLLVSGDHGQTLGGDHGGGSPEEVDSVLVAVDIGALHAASTPGGSSGSSGNGADSSSASMDTSGLVPPGLGAPAACRTNCSCGVERNQCAPDLPQMDLTPTLAAMLGVPIPFGNLGRLNAELWQLTAHRHSPGGGAARVAGTATADGAAAWERSLADALLANAQQVHAYLNTYAATAGASFSRAALAALNAQFESIPPLGEEPQTTVAGCSAYLQAAAAVAREEWTQFDSGSMAAGLVLFAATLALQVVATFGGAGVGSASTSAAAEGGKARPGGVQDKQKDGGGILARLGLQLANWALITSVSVRGRQLPVPAFRALLAAVVLAHNLGIFSFFYLLSEGRMVSILVGVACLALAVAAGRAASAAGQRVRGVVVLGVMSLRCNALMTVLGVAHHTGQGFWTRLTVHDSQPEGDVERGWHGKLAKAKDVVVALMAAAGLDQLPPAVLLVAQHTLLCTLPIIVLAAATERLQRGSPRGLLWRLLQLGAFASVAAYQQVEDAVKHGLLQATVTLAELAENRLWPALPASTTASLRAAADAVLRPALAALPPAAAKLAARSAAMPLTALLPHTTYALCGALAALWLVRAATRRLRGATAATAAAQVLVAALLQVSDRQAPLIILLALLEISAVARMLARRAELLPSGIGAGVAGEAGALLALVAAQMFYVTGHLCEFAGLQYTAGFTGFEDFHLLRSGTLLALNTFGAMLLALLALPAVVQYVVHAAAAAAAATPVLTDDAAAPSSNGKHAVVGRTASLGAGQEGSAEVSVSGPVNHSPPAVRQGSLADALHQAVAAAGLVSAGTAFCATLSAGLQRRHLYAWALFAPRFTFAAVKLISTGLTLLLVSLLA